MQHDLEFLALCKTVQEMEKTLATVVEEANKQAALLASFERRLTMRARDEAIASHQGGLPKENEAFLTRGKYGGKTHEWVVAKDYHYVVWNADNGYAEGLGFTDQQIEEARQLAHANPQEKRTYHR